MRAAHMGLLSNYLDFPLETHSPNSLLAADIIPSRMPFLHGVARVPQRAAKPCHEDHGPGEQAHTGHIKPGSRWLSAL